jgi:NAD(P)-dependent dehydrogenase (short-subunit alcohol dehydrogenase family)
MSRHQDLSGKVVVVTGAARGLGATLARQLDARGARLALLGLEPAELATVAASCRDARVWRVNVTDAAGLATVAGEVAAHFGGIDVVVANAGIANGGPLRLADADSYDRVIEVNLLGSVRTARAFLPHLVTSKGYFLQVASLAAIMPMPFMGAYCASKSGVEAFAHTLRPELAIHGVGVGVAYLSWTDTDMVRGADATPGLGDMRAELPWVFGRTYPVGPAVEAMVRGIERRSKQVYCQGWLRVMPLVRGLVPAVIGAMPVSKFRRTEQAIEAAGPAATHTVGAGGRADRAEAGS